MVSFYLKNVKKNNEPKIIQKKQAQRVQMELQVYRLVLCLGLCCRLGGLCLCDLLGSSGDLTGDMRGWWKEKPKKGRGFESFEGCELEDIRSLLVFRLYVFPEINHIQVGLLILCRFFCFLKVFAPSDLPEARTAIPPSSMPPEISRGATAEWMAIGRRASI